MHQTMKAIVNTRYGAAEVSKLTRVARPQVKETEVLVNVHMSTINRTDTGFRSAEYVISRFWSGLWKPNNPISGCEFAGEIVAIGKQVTRFQVGNKVFGFTTSNFGAHAEYLAVAEDSPMALLPKGFTYATAAPLTEGAHYALNYIRAAKIKEGSTVLVYGATGAIGSAAVQLLKYVGARVTAVCATDKLAVVKSLGPDAIIDYQRENYFEQDQQYDLVLDAVGKSSFKEAAKVLKPTGVYTSTELGRYTQNIFLALLTPLTGGKKVLFPIPEITQADVNWLRKVAEEGKFTPLVDREFTMEEFVAGSRYVESGQKTGNVLLRIHG